MDLTKSMKGAAWKIEPFPPGHYEEYSISENGTAKLLKKVQYHKPGDKPSFVTFVPWESMLNGYSWLLTKSLLLHLYKFSMLQLQMWLKYANILYPELSPTDVYKNIRTLMTGAIKKRLMADRQIGCLLSGGLDSSLVAALLVKLAKETNIPYKIQSFAIGMGESPDIIAARQVTYKNWRHRRWKSNNLSYCTFVHL